MEEKLGFTIWEGEGQFMSSASLDETTDLFHDLLDKEILGERRFWDTHLFEQGVVWPVIPRCVYREAQQP